MLRMKKTIPMDIICEGLPVEFQLLLEHARTLKFEERPNYKYLHSLIQRLLSQHNSQEPSVDQSKAVVDQDVAGELMSNRLMKEVPVQLQLRRYVYYMQIFYISFFNPYHDCS